MADPSTSGRYDRDSAGGGLPPLSPAGHSSPTLRGLGGCPPERAISLPCRPRRPSSAKKEFSRASSERKKALPAYLRPSVSTVRTSYPQDSLGSKAHANGIPAYHAHAQPARRHLGHESLDNFRRTSSHSMGRVVVASGLPAAEGTAGLSRRTASETEQNSRTAFPKLKPLRQSDGVSCSCSVGHKGQAESDPLFEDGPGVAPKDSASGSSCSSSSAGPSSGPTFQRTPSQYVRDKIFDLYSRKESHYIKDNHASFELNKMSGGGTFGSTWVRPTQLKRYYRVFKDMHVDKHGKLSLEQFSKYLSEKNPELAAHSNRLFKQMLRRNSTAGEDSLDFVTVLKLLYPQASETDIAALRDMSSSYGLPKKRDLIRKLEECRVLFKLLNKTNDNALTREQMEDGLLSMGQDIREVWKQIGELFGSSSDGAATTSVDLMTFFQWYSDIQLPPTSLHELRST